MDMSMKLNLSYPTAKPATPVADKPVEKPQADVVALSTVKEESKSAQTEQDKLKMAIKEIEEFVQSVKRNLEFSIDEPSGKVVVKVIASDSGEVIRQIPNEEVLKLANSLNDASSLLFSAKV
ncbi:flagellar protein FlaG [Pseudomonas chlororaphis]|uniref:flagellar protein FlaG n=1 Tax=Pseudomonas chlororaphis TaxID=587753 RepID=UPI0006A5E062|nr:flagellar protein FlaG [Pseudomonas chlororaphis]AZD00894.1 Flagellar protein FlaG [Pseudomonas chlororaphis subsp. chlororaphis]MBM0284295.1 flagellar protein FlaG [Pseudomonas chlororaphis]MDO1505252.1 flagellar protein FlaG [Pseudomonas chlororaphis]ORM50375.1 flagellar biosynthesis protein FlaG [Pseudomonas chlororaphis subsp. chlororaphis]TWR99546.1 flagellar protein FlaG [Pseudomonas chlororaphis subsp. chlororaphis]